MGTDIRYAILKNGEEALFKGLLTGFSPSDLTNWYKIMGSGTFTGNGGKIFTKSGAPEVLKHWLEYLNASPLFEFRGSCEFTGFGDRPGLFMFRQGGQALELEGDYAVFALGGGSCPETGSNGAWVNAFQAAGR